MLSTSKNRGRNLRFDSLDQKGFYVTLSNLISFFSRLN